MLHCRLPSYALRTVCEPTKLPHDLAQKWQYWGKSPRLVFRERRYNLPCRRDWDGLGEFYCQHEVDAVTHTAATCSQDRRHGKAYLLLPHFKKTGLKTSEVSKTNGDFDAMARRGELLQLCPLEVILMIW